MTQEPKDDPVNLSGLVSYCSC